MIENGKEEVFTVRGINVKGSMQKSFLTTAEEEEIDQQEKNQSGHNYFPIRDGMKEAKKWLQKIG